MKTLDTPFLRTSYLNKVDFPAGEIKYLDFSQSSTPELSSGNVLSLSVFIKCFHLETFTISADIGSAQEQELNEKFGIDTKSMIKKTLQNEMTVGMEKNLYKKYLELAESHPVSKWKSFFKKYFKIEFPLFVEGSWNSLVRKLVMHSNLIAARSRKGGANFAILSSSAVSILEDSPLFVYTDTGKVSSGKAFEHVGMIGNFQIFRNSYAKFDDSKVILGRMSKENESGVYLCYKDDYDVQEIIDSISLRNKILVKSRHCIIDAGNAKNNFSSFEIDFGKKPWWRKFLNL